MQLKAPDSVPAGEPAAVEADVIGRAEGATLVWTTSTGTITNGQGTDKITVDTAGLEGKSVITTVELRGLRTECLNRTAQFTTLVGPSA